MYLEIFFSAALLALRFSEDNCNDKSRFYFFFEQLMLKTAIERCKFALYLAVCYAHPYSWGLFFPPFLQ